MTGPRKPATRRRPKPPEPTPPTTQSIHPAPCTHGPHLASLATLRPDQLRISQCTCGAYIDERGPEALPS